MVPQIAQGRAFTLGFTLLLATACGACDSVRAKVQSLVCVGVAAGSGAHAAGAHAQGAAGHTGAAGGAAPTELAQEDRGEGPDLTAEDTAHLSAAAKFALPFAWEKSPAEPLSRARTFLRELVDDNAQFVSKQGAGLKSYAARETPRTTVLTCADSRVQTSAFDTTPENDAYTVRNLGNQVEASLGAVQYGIDVLNTPVLLVLGHTGCEAVRAALSSDTRVDEPIRKELSGMHVGKLKGRADDKRLTTAVIDNVHDQVKAALKRFSPHVTASELTIVGAVYDLRNELGKGPGKLTIINVNGNRDEARLKAFMDAILSGVNPKGKGAAARENPLDRLARALSESANTGGDEEEEEVTEEEPQPAAAPAQAVPAESAHH